MESVTDNCSLVIPTLFDRFGGMREHTGEAMPVLVLVVRFFARPGDCVIMTTGLLYHSSWWVFLTLFKSTNHQSFDAFTSQTCLIFCNSCKSFHVNPLGWAELIEDTALICFSKSQNTYSSLLPWNFVIIIYLKFTNYIHITGVDN